MQTDWFSRRISYDKRHFIEAMYVVWYSVAATDFLCYVDNLSSILNQTKYLDVAIIMQSHSLEALRDKLLFICTSFTGTTAYNVITLVSGVPVVPKCLWRRI